MRRTKSDGFSLLEVLASISILTIVVSAVGPSFIKRAKLDTQAEIKTAAIQAAQSTLDMLRLLDPVTFPSSGSDAPESIVVGDRTFSVVTSYCENTIFCASSRSRHLTIRVHFAGEQIYEIETVFTKLK